MFNDVVVRSKVSVECVFGRRLRSCKIDGLYE